MASLIWNAFAGPLRDPKGLLLGSAIVALMLWGYHGNLELLGMLWDGWAGPGSDPSARARIIPGIAWDQEWLSFWAGALLVVGIPAIMIRYVFKLPLREFGLGLPPRGLRRLALMTAAVLFVASFGAFYQYGNDPAMASTYPFFRDFDGVGQFVVYELGYLPFFLAIEFIFRGYLLFGLYLLPTGQAPAGNAGGMGQRYPLDWRILVPMLAYTAWHLGKPLPELWGTLFWGPAASAIVLATRSIWPVVIVHWLLNVWMDLVIWQQW
ncbi:CPBP family glutamic-type intramembrane protease [Solimonas sp. K1W22B-7]|nr:CPBP family glutamic-type intramembrane protease [Solimonas sp. K1W22B-7]